MCTNLLTFHYIAGQCMTLLMSLAVALIKAYCLFCEGAAANSWLHLWIQPLQ